MTTRTTPEFARAAVAAPHPAATAAGQAVLEAGGNAIEAMLAVAATIAVVYPHMNGIGGDNFWVIREPSGRVRTIEAVGFAGKHATIDRYKTLGLAAIPVRGPQAALTVPGVVGGWSMAKAMAEENGGRLPRDMLLDHAIRAAGEGHAIGASEARYVLKDEETLLANPFFKETYYKDGNKPPEGWIRKLPALANTLRQIADAGYDDAYRGDIAREMATDLASIGSAVTREDLAAFKPFERTPLKAKLKDATIYMPPPPSQGLGAQLMLGIFDQLPTEMHENADHIHRFVEAVKRANRIRDKVVTEQDRLQENPQEYLTTARFQREAARIDLRQAAPWPLPPEDDGDTVWCGAIDANGMAVSLIQSIFWEYGSGCVLPKTGILMQNRGLGLSLDPLSLNALKPGRRPFHTLHAPMAVFDDGRIASYGSMGGEVQSQITSQNFLRFARFGMAPTDALHAPRFHFGRAWGADRATLKVENRFDSSILDALRRKGHDVEVNAKDYADSFGHAGILVRDTNGRIRADHDPRADGDAKGM
jgi:oxamate amidohydrolase